MGVFSDLTPEQNAYLQSLMNTQDIASGIAGHATGSSQAFMAGAIPLVPDSVNANESYDEPNFLQNAGYFVGDTLVSAGLGIVNTGISLAAAVGLASDSDKLNVHETIRDIFGDNAANFYSNNQTAVDFTGLILSSLIPASIAIKGLHIAQEAGVLGKSMQLASGLKNADYMLGTNAMKEATAQVLSKQSYVFNQKPVYSMIARGFYQRTLEGLAASAGISAMTNQSPFLGNEDLTYFQATAKTFTENAPFDILFGGVGGVFAAAKINRAFRDTFEELEVNLNNYSPVVANLTDKNAGDVLYSVAAHRQALNAIGIPEDFAKTENGTTFWNNKKRELDFQMNKIAGDALSKIVGGKDKSLVDHLLTQFNAPEMDAQAFGDMVIGLNSAGHFSKKDIADVVEFSNKQRTLQIGFEDVPNFTGKETVETLSEDQKTFINKFGEIYNSLMGSQLDGKVQAEQFQQLFVNELVHGADSIANPNGMGLSIHGEPFVPEGSMLTRNLPVQFVFKAANVSESTLNTINVSRKILGLPAFTNDDVLLSTKLHELTHSTAQSAAQMDEFNSSLMNLLVPRSKIPAENTEEFAKTFKPKIDLINQFAESRIANRGDLDRNSEILRALRAVVKANRTQFETIMPKGLTDDGMLMVAMNQANTRNFVLDSAPHIFGDSLEEVLDANQIGMRDYAKYLMSSYEVHADAGAIFGNPLTREIASRKYPAVASYFEKFGAALRPFNPKIRYYNRVTGELHTNALPGVNDLPGTILKNGKVVVPEMGKTYTRNSTALNKLYGGDAKYDQYDFLHSNAQFAIASKMPLDSLRIRNAKQLLEVLRNSKAGITAAKKLDKGTALAKVTGVQIPHSAENAAGQFEPSARIYASAKALGSTMSTKLEDYVGPVYSVSYNDLPMLERLITDPQLFTGISAETPLKEIPTLIIPELGRSFSGREDFKALQSLVFQRKLELRTKLAAAGKSSDYISKYLNTNDKFAGGDADALTREIGTGFVKMGEQNFDEPELSIFRYNDARPADRNVDAQSYYAQRYRDGIINDMRSVFFNRVIGQAADTLPTPDQMLQKLHTMTSLEVIRTLVTGARTKPGSFGESAVRIGKVYAGLDRKQVAEINDAYAPWVDKFARPENAWLKHQYALLINAARRDWHHVVKSSDGKTFFIKDDFVKDVGAVNSILEAAALPAIQGADESLYFLNQVPSEILMRFTNADTGNVKRVLDELAPLIDETHSRNIEHRGILAEAAQIEGRTYGYQDSLFYPPKVNLSQINHFAFIVPKDAIRDADPRKFMVYANDADGLAQKVKAIEAKYGDDYDVLTNPQVEAYKRAVDEYKRDLVFDSQYFDSSLKRTGEAAELTPALDLGRSSALHETIDMVHRQAKRNLYTAFEAQYADVFANLQLRDAAATMFSSSKVKLPFGLQTPDSAFKAVAKTMLDKEVIGDVASQMFTRVNDFLGLYGSRALNAAMRPLIAGARKVAGLGGVVTGGINSRLDSPTFTDNDLQLFNKAMEKAGIKSPYKSVAEAIFNDHTYENQHSLEVAVKAWSNIISRYGLQMDGANNIIQLMSNPILLHPAIKEALEYARVANPGLKEQLTNMITVPNPINGIKEPTPMKMIFAANRRRFTQEGKDLMKLGQDAHLINEYNADYQEMVNLENLAGKDALQKVHGAIQKAVNFGVKWSGYNFAEQHSRYLCLDVAKQIADVYGLGQNEMLSLASGLIDKVHGTYTRSTRIGLSRGIVGQAMSMYQHYFVNYLQNLWHYAGDPNSSNIKMMLALQSSMFGVQSLPGFSQFNAFMTSTGANGKVSDIYSALDADKPNTIMDYAMYGLGSHALISPMSFYSRGDIAIRNPTLFPTNVEQFPVVSMTAKVIANILNVAKMVSNGAPVDSALIHGLAHNGLSRPLQGLGTIIQGTVTNGYGKTFFENSNYVDNNALKGWNYGGMVARILGVQPLSEAILKDQYYRQKSYQASVQDDATALGTAIRVSINNGQIPSQDSMEAFANGYMKIHGDLNNWNKWWIGTMKNSNSTLIEDMKKQLGGNNAVGRANRQLQEAGSAKKIWEYY